MKDFILTANNEYNYLLLQISGHLLLEDAELLKIKLVETAETMKEGFILIHDLSLLELSPEDPIKKLLEVHSLLKEKGCKKVIRIRGRCNFMVTKEFDFFNTSNLLPTEYFDALNDVLLLLHLQKIQEKK